MRAFFSDDQLLHQPRQFMRAGRLCEPTDVPARAAALQAALAARGIDLAVAPDYGRAPLEAVHSAAYLDFLCQAYERWQALARPGFEPGIEVLPNLSPYHNGKLDQSRRPDCPTDSVIAQAGYYLGDLSCPLGPHSWLSILRSAHSAVAAADYVCEQQDGGMAYALCRPSGHHAHSDRAGGFCYVNNAAIAAQGLLKRFGKVAVLDVDAHHGDGTQQIFYQRSDVMTISLHADPAGYYPFYTGYANERGYGAGYGYNLNFPLPHGTGDAGFLAALDSALDALRDYRPQALVLSLGFDTYVDDPISVLAVGMDGYRGIGERIHALGVPTVVVQEGGYEVEAIGPALDAFLSGFAPAMA
ncbi:histone deacetylase family protein [Cupriavidus gilardii]|uniref:histone deacetylase family protein n=1 Tax=Cupriavidus gilardii TaxID=82541 RepID=UPI0021BE3832|nr:histone deacetylase family protein [Cupriavidus gilardii]MCT9126605.1 histone deacetylase family protein [Cupriavidus gilardii]